MTKLKILVPVKRVLDGALKPRITNGKVDTKGAKFSINPFDDIAMEEAAKIRKSYKKEVESIHAVSIGPSKAKEVLRIALAKGADTSTLYETESEVEPLAVSKILQKVIQEEGSNLVILGKQAIDDDSNQVGQMLGGLLGWSQATNACNVKIDIENGQVEVEKEIDGGVETVKAQLPMIITTDLRLNVPKFVTLPKMMKAKKKPLKVVPIEETGVDLTKRLEVVNVEEPTKREAGIMVNNVDELITKLKELKAI
ncbi:Cir1 protein [Martiniozyma asiatica (nom. inval.)]|nr:Cir1 protein [Martiniozyma asiatica]